jgi:hypothetical protein
MSNLVGVAICAAVLLIAAIRYIVYVKESRRKD